MESNIIPCVLSNFLNFGAIIYYATKIEESNLIFLIFCAKIEENISGIGVVVRDENGLVLGSCSKHLPQACGAMEVKAMAAATALVFAYDIGARWVILEGDSLTVIKAL